MIKALVLSVAAFFVALMLSRLLARSRMSVRVGRFVQAAIGFVVGSAVVLLLSQSVFGTSDAFEETRDLLTAFVVGLICAAVFAVVGGETMRSREPGSEHE